MSLSDYFMWVVEPIDRSLGGLSFLGVSTGRWLALAIAAAIGLILGWLSAFPLRLVLRRIRQRTPSVVLDQGFEHRLTAPIGMLVAIAVIRGSVDLLGIHEPVGPLIQKVCDVVFMAVAALLVIRLIGVAKEYLQALLTRRLDDPGKLRSITTRLAIPARILQFVAGLAGVALVFLQFQAVQEVGVSLLASAGLMGVIVGLAAQRIVGNLLAGLQLAFAEPVRIGDTVIVEGENGVIEQMGLSHVVIKVWDLRRLIVPVSYFIEKPFQNWTKDSPEMMGTVFLYTNFSVSVQEVRDELDRWLAETDLWNGKAKSVQVTDLTADKVELRILVSAANAGKLFELRCLLRERLLVWMQSRGGKYLAVRRVEEVAAMERSKPAQS